MAEFELPVDLPGMRLSSPSLSTAAIQSRTSFIARHPQSPEHRLHEPIDIFLPRAAPDVGSRGKSLVRGHALPLSHRKKSRRIEVALVQLPPESIQNRLEGVRAGRYLMWVPVAGLVELNVLCLPPASNIPSQRSTSPRARRISRPLSDDHCADQIAGGSFDDEQFRIVLPGLQGQPPSVLDPLDDVVAKEIDPILVDSQDFLPPVLPAHEEIVFGRPDPFARGAQAHLGQPVSHLSVDARVVSFAAGAVIVLNDQLDWLTHLFTPPV